jgi:hypothetical protein
MKNLTFIVVWLTSLPLLDLLVDKREMYGFSKQNDTLRGLIEEMEWVALGDPGEAVSIQAPWATFYGT